MVTYMKEHGKTMLNKGLENCIYRMARNMKANFCKGISTDKAFIPGKMEIDMKETLCLIKEKDLGSIFGMKEDIIKGNGRPKE